MTDERFAELLDLAVDRLDRSDVLDVGAFVAKYPEAAGELEEFLLTMLAWRAANGQSHERIRAGVLAALPDLVKRVRSRNLGDLFAELDVNQARSLGIRVMSYRRLREDRTLLIDLETGEQQSAKAKELRIDDQLLQALIRQLTDTLRAVDVLFAARHDEDPTEEE